MTWNCVYFVNFSSTIFKIWYSTKILIKFQRSLINEKLLINIIFHMLCRICSQLRLILTKKLLFICSKIPWNPRTRQHFLVHFFHHFFNPWQNVLLLDLLIYHRYRIREYITVNVPVIKLLINYLFYNHIAHFNQNNTAWKNSTQSDVCILTDDLSYFMKKRRNWRSY